MSTEAGDWGSAPSALGMRVTREGLVGTWNGRVEVRATHVAYTGSSARLQGPDEEHGGIWTERGQASSEGTVLTATLSPALQLGLRAVKRWPPASDAAPEHFFHLAGGDLERIRRVLSGPVMTEVLRDAAAGPPVFEGLELHDDYVQTRAAQQAFITDPAVLGRGLGWLGRIAEALLAQVAAERPAWEAALLPAWSAVASRWGLVFDPAKHSMKGTVRGREVTVLVHAGSDELMTEVRVGLVRPLGCTITLSREAHGARGFLSGLLKKLGGEREIEVGDPALDGALVVRGEPEPVVRATLAPAVRERMLQALAVFETMSVWNDSLAAWAELALAPEPLDRHVSLAFATAEALDAGRR